MVYDPYDIGSIEKSVFAGRIAHIFKVFVDGLRYRN